MTFKQKLKTPGGLLFTVAIFIVPLFVYGLQVYLGVGLEKATEFIQYHKYVYKDWVIMEVVTIVVACVVLYYVRFSFIVFAIGFTLWYLSMDITPMICGDENLYHNRKIVSIVFGAIMILVAYFIYHRTKKDYAFWIYLFGVLAFWFGLSLMKSNSIWGKHIYCLINLFLLCLSVFLQRRVFAIFGTIGVMGYLGYLSSNLFRGEVMLIFVLTIIGVVIITLAVLYKKNKSSVDQFIESLVPESLKKLRPSARK